MLKPARRASLFELTLSMLIALGGAATITFGEPPPPLWTANEVSILLPLPSSVELASHPRLSRFLTQAQYQAIVGHNLAASTTVVRAHLAESNSLIGIRIDPCFKDLPTDSCDPQIRMIWQPLWTDPNSKVRAVDAAVHTFHSLTAAQLSELLASVRALNAPHRSRFDAPTGTALDIHPVLLAEGYASEYARELLRILFASASAGRLTRVTGMGLHAFGAAWEFFGSDIDATGMARPRSIPLLRTFRITFENLLQHPAVMLEEMRSMGWAPVDFVDGSGATRTYAELPRRHGFTMTGPIAQRISSNANVIRFLKDSETFPSDRLGALTRSMDLLEDPRRHSAGTTDCISCHAVAPIRSYLAHRTTDLFTSKSFRMFGYFESHVSIAERMRNETTAVVNLLNAPEAPAR